MLGFLGFPQIGEVDCFVESVDGLKPFPAILDRPPRIGDVITVWEMKEGSLLTTKKVVKVRSVVEDVTGKLILQLF